LSQDAASGLGGYVLAQRPSTADGQRGARKARIMRYRRFERVNHLPDALAFGQLPDKQNRSRELVAREFR